MIAHVFGKKVGYPSIRVNYIEQRYGQSVWTTEIVTWFGGETVCINRIHNVIFKSSLKEEGTILSYPSNKSLIKRFSRYPGWHGILS